MIVRIAVAILLVASAAAPAVALEFCKTEVVRDGQGRLAQGWVDGAALRSLLIEDDDIPGALVLDPAASGYTVSVGGAISLTPYRIGQSLEGKDWHTAGSVATYFGGFALHWPRFYKDGKRVDRTTIYFDASGLRAGTTISNLSTRPDAETLFTTWDQAWYLNSPDRYLTHGIYDSAAQQAWAAATVSGNLRVEFYDGKTTLGTATFEWPGEAAWNARMIPQVNALRKLHADGKCAMAATLDLDLEDDEDF